ncbi:MAG: Uncharacterised protein [Polaribacter sejongensis]|nr:MAG: Uncharacterised protein [Polaribacter sejongensis]
MMTKGFSVSPILRMTTKINPKKRADTITKTIPIELTSIPNPLIIKTPVNATKNRTHCIGFIFSFKKINAKIAAKIGAVYLNETAVPTAK